jgi:hypothetical protein
MRTKEGREMDYCVLDQNVLAVAVQGGAGDDWAAYVGAVDGMSHDVEAEGAMRTGSKLRSDVARLLFPEFARAYKWRP